MLKVFTLSGYEGVGKSTLINHFQKNNDFKVIPETARLILPLQDTVLRDSKDDLSYKSFISYLTNMHFMLSNHMSFNVISDRNLVDSLTYLKMYSKEQSIGLVETGDFIERFLEEYNREYLYNETVLIKHPENDSHILENILSDPERVYGKNVSQYKRDAQNWEEIYISIAEYLNTRGLSKKLTITNCYIENVNITHNLEKLFNA